MGSELLLGHPAWTQGLVGARTGGCPTFACFFPLSLGRVAIEDLCGAVGGRGALIFHDTSTGCKEILTRALLSSCLNLLWLGVSARLGVLAVETWVGFRFFFGELRVCVA